MMTGLAAALLLGAGSLATGQSTATAAEKDPVDALEHAAHPLRATEPGGGSDDLRPFGRMVDDATVVTVGESTHSSHEFVTMHRRLFHYLAEEKGFGTFARELSWSTGVLLNEYVQNGTGDPREIMDRELETFYQVFDNREFLELVESLRAYNARHEEDVQIIGPDIAYAGPVLFDKVDGYLTDHRPRLRPAIRALYAGLRPEPGTHLSEYMADYTTKPLTERRLLEVKARTALRLLQATAPDEDSPHREAFEWTQQHARAIAQTAKGYSFDTTTDFGLATWGAWRDETMADNLEWWNERTGDKVMVSTMNAHASYEPIEPGLVPKPVGQNLRERFGDAHVNVGFSFAKGGFNAMGPDEKYDTFDVQAEPGQNEHTLDEVGYDDYFVDLRSAPPAARQWLTTPRPTFNIGGEFDPGAPEATVFDVALGRSYDVLFHLSEVRATDLLFD